MVAEALASQVCGWRYGWEKRSLVCCSQGHLAPRSPNESKRGKAFRYRRYQRYRTGGDEDGQTGSIARGHQRNLVTRVPQQFLRIATSAARVQLYLWLLVRTAPPLAAAPTVSTPPPPPLQLHAAMRCRVRRALSVAVQRLHWCALRVVHGSERRFTKTLAWHGARYAPARRAQPQHVDSVQTPSPLPLFAQA